MPRPIALALPFAAFAALLALAMPLAAQPAPAPPACADEPALHRLDFWLGDWEVFAGERRVGANRISPILAGCAVVEEWTAEGGGEGRSLFYYVAATKRWKQVWVTAKALGPGGVKEKELIEELPGGGLRFQGTVPLPGGGSYLDRTTLTPESGGRVRQLIEISRDGTAWQTTFDALYLRPGAGSPQGTAGGAPAIDQ